MRRTLLFGRHGFNIALIGKDAQFIAREAGYQGAGREDHGDARRSVSARARSSSREKLCPVLGFLRGQDNRRRRYSIAPAR